MIGDKFSISSFSPEEDDDTATEIPEETDLPEEDSDSEGDEELEEE